MVPVIDEVTFLPRDRWPPHRCELETVLGTNHDAVCSRTVEMANTFFFSNVSVVVDKFQGLKGY